MIKKDSIRRSMEEAVAKRGCFIVDVRVDRDNNIELTVESEEGMVTMDDCVDLSNRFQELFDRDEEDYSLTVSSAGLDQPFKVLKQFVKAIGSRVELRLRDGRKLTGSLEAADGEKISLRYKLREKVEGKKKRETVERCDDFPMSEVNSVRPHMEF